MARGPFTIALVVLVLSCATSPWAVAAEEPREAEDTSLEERGLPEGWYARLRTGMGEILARLLPEQSPQAVAHFTALAEGRLEWIDPFTGQPSKNRYYDGLTIHRVAAAERFEAGDPTASGQGSAPFYLPPEGFGPVNFSRPWRLGMTRASLGRISGSLFFMTAGTVPWLNGKHPCFGVVIEGKEVVLRITEVKADSSGKPLNPIALEEVRILKVGNPEPLPEPERFVPKQLNFRVRDDLKIDR